jgi:hypothetical protein
MNITAEQRFWTKVDKTRTCWNWTASVEGKGYGQFRAPNQKMVKAHRFAYEQLVGPIPGHLQLDHRCRNKRCVRPDHLRIVTDKQNKENLTQLGRSISGIRGVTWSKKSQKWQAIVKHNRRLHSVGLFDNLSDAEAAVIAKRNELFTHNDADRDSGET